jgi:ribose 5-phosphate isomerase B
VRYAVAADHAGVGLKGLVLDELRRLGHSVDDLGGDGSDPGDDYPDYAERVGLALRGGTADRAVLVCGSGVGAAVAASKMAGVRAAVCHDAYSARQGVEHDDLNVLVLGARVVGPELARELVRAFAGARFDGGERHARRLAKVRDLERRHAARERE